MISPFTVGVILFLRGTLMGIYLPGVVLYGVSIWRSSPSWESAAWSITKRFLLALFGLFVLAAVVSHLALAVLGPTPNAMLSLFLVLGVLVGLIGGGWFAWRAIRRSRKSSAAHPEAQAAVGERCPL
jgi:hypothetical protein